MSGTNKLLVVGILLLAVVIPLTTWLAVTNQESRSKATTDANGVYVADVVDGKCGVANGTTVTSLPSVVDACAQGAVNWMDREGTDKDGYNWDCYGTTGKAVAHCSATKN